MKGPEFMSTLSYALKTYFCAYDLRVNLEAAVDVSRTRMQDHKEEDTVT
jgi:hypothetical protein